MVPTRDSDGTNQPITSSVKRPRLLTETLRSRRWPAVHCWHRRVVPMVASALVLGTLTSVVHPLVPTKTAQAAVSADAVVAGGDDFSMVLKSDGTVWAWGADPKSSTYAYCGGYSYCGELGDGSPPNQYSGGSLVPVQVSQLSGIRSIAAGSVFGLALKSDGTVWGWGDNTYGELGNGSTVIPATPQLVSGLTNVIAIAAGGYSSYAVKSDGTVWSWGYNYWGQLGNNSTNASNVPVQVSGLSGISGIAAGYDFALAFQSSAGVWAWGHNNSGQLGNGTTTDSSVPVPVSGFSAGSGVIDVAANSTGSSSYALKSDGTAWSWGANSSGQLGDGTTVYRSSPVQVYGVYNAVSISAGSNHALALLYSSANTYTVAAWGSNSSGQLGNGTTNTIPYQMAKTVPGMSGAVAVAAGTSNSLAVKSDGTVSSWGYDYNGQLGNGGRTDSSTPVQVVAPSGSGSFASATQPAAYAQPSATAPTGPSDVPQQDRVAAGGDDFSMVLKSDGTVWAWGADPKSSTYAYCGGYSYCGELGTGSPPNQNSGGSLVPVQVWQLSGIRSIAAGSVFGLALKSDGTVWSWGDNTWGELGNGSTVIPATPQLVSGLTNVIAIAAGGYSSYAVKSDGTVWSWGYNYWGQLGNNSTNSSNVPVQVSGLTAGISGIAAGYDFALAFQSNAGVWAWGHNNSGQLGNGTTTNSSVPVQVSGFSAGSGVIDVAANSVGESSYALKSDGTAWSWGSNSAGQLGDGTTTFRSSPVRVLGLGGVVAIAAGSNHALALRADGSVASWGMNTSGQLGNGTTTNTSLAALVPGFWTLGLASGANFSLSVRWDGAWSWGDNSSGELGTGNRTGSTYPVQVSGLTDVAIPPFVTQSVGGPPSTQELFGGSNPSEPRSGSTRGCYCRPIDSESGNFWHTFTDLSTPGRGPAFSFSRSYNSASASTNGPFGDGWRFSYGASLSVSGSTVTIVQENGSQVAFTLANGAYSAPPRVVATLVHNGDGTYTFTRQARQRLTFSSAGALLSIADLNGNTTSLSYNGSGQLTTITDPVGRAVTLGWTGTHITSLTDANVTPNRVVQYSYDASGNLGDVTDVAGGNEHFTYDANHLLLTMRDPRGNTVTNHYDASNRADWQTDELNRKTTFGYGSNTTTITDPKGNATLEQYSNGLRTSLTKGYGTAAAATWTTAYDLATLGVSTSTDPNNHATTMTYDGRGNTLTVTDPLGRRTVNSYDALNDLTSTTDPKGVTTTYSYDASGNLTQVSTPLVGASPAVNQVTTYTHGDSSHPGDVTAVTDADGKTSHMSYDAAGDLTSSADPLGDTTTSTYNAIGWLLTSVSPKGNVAGCGCAAAYTTSYGHDARSQVTTTTDPLGHVTSRHYDADGNLDQLTDGDGNLTTYVYDAANEQTQVQRADSPQTTLVTDYNADGTMLDQKDGAANTTTYVYDALGRVTSITTPATAACASGCATSYTYDGAGNRLTLVDPAGATTATTYDAANQPTGITYSDGTTPIVSSIIYDTDGQRTGMTDGTGTSQWVYDSLHRLTSYTNGAGATVGFDYTTAAGAQDLLNRVGHVTYPNSAGTIARGYDDAGRLTSVTDWNGKTISFGYDVNSNLTTSSVPSATPVTDSFGVNAADQTTSVTTSNGTTLFSATYARDGNGQLTADTSVPSAVGAFRYTSLNQLCYAGSSTATACASPPTGSQPFGYDAADNLTTLGGTTQKFDAADQLCWTSPTTSANGCGTTPSGGTTFGYNSRGDRTSMVPPTGSAQCDRYDQVNRLSSVVAGAGSTCASPSTIGTYAYDGDGLRQSKTVGSTTTRFTWDVSGALPLLLQESTGGGSTSYLYGPGGMLIEQVTPARPAITQVGSASTAADGNGTAGALALALPSGTAAGDQILVATTYQAGATNTATVPTGFSAVGSSANSGGVPLTANVTQVFRKTAAAGDTSVTISYNGTFPKAAIALVYRGADPAMPVDLVATGATALGTTVSVSGATQFPNERLVAIQGASYAATAAGSWAAPSGMTEQASKDATVVTLGAADASQGSAGATGTRTSTFTPGGTSTTPPQLTAVLVGLQTPATVTFAHHDQLGSTRLLTDQAGVARGTFTFDPYGNLTNSTGSVTTPLLWAGQYRDSESGFYYLRARYYDPSTAQMLTRDPLASMTRQPYQYANDNPLNNSDRTGLCSWNPFDSDSCEFAEPSKQVSSWAGDINNFINNNQFGGCINVSAGIGPGFVASACVTFNAHSFGLTGTYGTGWELPGGASVTAGPMFASGARNPEDLGGGFDYTGVSAGELFPVGAIDSASGYGTCGQPVTQYNLSVGAGVNLPWPASVHQGQSNTWVWQP